MSILASDARQTKAFNQRVYYYKKRGLSHDEAVAKAQRSDHKDLTILNTTPPALTVLYKPKIAEKEPTQEEIKAEVERLKSSGQFCEINDDRECSPEKNYNETSLQQSTSNSPIETVISFSICIGSFVLLIHSAAEVFNFSLEGWAKAFILELGIVGLSIYESSNRLRATLARLTAVILVCVSCFASWTVTERARVEASHSANSSVDSVAAEKEVVTAQLSLLREDRKIAQQKFQASLGSEKQEAYAKMLELSDKMKPLLEKKRSLASEKPSVPVVSATYTADLFYRLCLIVLSIFFAARLKELARNNRDSAILA
jgi:hypothetical protein